jgi:glucan phosphoethanolaminetransferase (alkaline phosphatase superfamily)
LKYNIPVFFPVPDTGKRTIFGKAWVMKRTIGRILALLYIVILLVCITFVIKPEASIFNIKHTIGNQELVPDAGFAYRYKLGINPFFLRTYGIRVYENGEELVPTQGNIVVNDGKNTFSLSETSPGAGYLYLSSSDNSNPITNDRKYTLYFPLRFVSRRLGFIYFAILLPFLALFLYFALSNPDHRRTLQRSPKGIVLVWDHFFEYITGFIQPTNESTRQQIKARASYWKKLFTITILIAYFYIFMEWIFLATMPSFMSVLSLSKKLEIFLLSSLGLALICIVVITFFILLDIFSIFAHFSRFTSYLGLVIPTIILSALALLLIDNFTYTVFKFGISSTTGIWRGVYGLLFIALMVYFFFQMQKVFGLRGAENTNEKPNNRLFFVAVSLLAISFVLALTNFNFKALTYTGTQAINQELTRQPNILLLSGDGLSAENLSVYGYDRDTTPRLEELAQDSLVAENAFPNSGTTTASEVATLTSKLPTTTRFGFPFDKLSGVNAYQHLPGILKDDGYKTLEFGIPFYDDAYNFNMQDSFDMVNGQSQRESPLVNSLRKLGYDNSAYLLSILAGRISDRILHIFFIRDMQNPYLLVTQPTDSLNDTEKIDQVLSQFDQSEEPLFIHVHLMGTHGPEYSPPVQFFSKGEKQDQPGMTDFYDDTLLSFDQYVGEVIDHLKATGKYDNTILIIYTDHDKNWWITNRIPLIIHFPGGQFAGRITQNVQNMDIAPTILDYLGLPKPDWMSGATLLNNDLNNHRLIFSVGTLNLKNYDSSGKAQADPEVIKPPFYQFGYISAIECQKWYFLNLSTLGYSSGDIPNYGTPCSTDSLHSFDEIKQAISDRLSSDGFDVSSLP